MLDGVEVLCHSAIKLSGSKIIYIDPYGIEEATHDADFIFVTHEHYDHFSPEDIRKVSKEQTILVAPYSMKQVVCEQVGKMVGCVEYVNAEESGTVLNREDILIKWVRAYNINKPFHTREMGWIGYVVTLDGETYFVTGDTDANEDNIDVQCDVLLVPCGGKYTFDVKEASEFTHKIKPKKVIPTHYTDVIGESEVGDRFKRATMELSQDIEIEVML